MANIAYVVIQSLSDLASGSGSATVYNGLVNWSALVVAPDGTLVPNEVGFQPSPVDGSYQLSYSDANEDIAAGIAAQVRTAWSDTTIKVRFVLGR